MGNHGSSTGDASAVPQYLYDYASRSLSGVQDLQAFARSIGGAIAEYQRTAIDFGQGIFSGGEGTGPDALDAVVRRLVAQVVSTDTWVATVGGEFARAGQQSGLTPPADLTGIVPPATGPGVRPGDPFHLNWRISAVHTTDAALEAIAGNDGAALVNELLQGLDDAHGPRLGPFFAQLRAESMHDPTLSASFFNHLTPTLLASLLNYRQWQSPGLNARHAFPTGLRDLITAFAAAEAGGKLDPAHERLFVQTVFQHDQGGDLVIPLLQALGDNPPAASAFARLHPPRSLTGLFRGSPPTQQQAAYLHFLRADMQQNPDQAEPLMKLVTSLLVTYPKGEHVSTDQALLTVTSSGFQALSPQVAAFLQTYISLRIHSPGADVGVWMNGDDKGDTRGITGLLAELKPFAAAMMNTAHKEDVDYAKSSEQMKALMTTVLLAGSVEVAPEADLLGETLLGSEKLADLGSRSLKGAVLGGAVFKGEPAVTKFLWGEEADEGEESWTAFNTAMERYAKLVVLHRLAEAGQIRLGSDGRAVSWKELTGGAGGGGLRDLLEHPPQRYWADPPGAASMPLSILLGNVHAADGEVPASSGHE